MGRRHHIVVDGGGCRSNQSGACSAYIVAVDGLGTVVADPDAVPVFVHEGYVGKASPLPVRKLATEVSLWVVMMTLHSLCTAATDLT